MAFKKTAEVEEKGKGGKMVKTVKVVDEKFYYGEVGNPPHDTKYYEEIAKDIIPREGAEWPQVAQVSVTKGKKQINVPWTQVATRDDLKGKF